ncbi:DUF5667 domain-containing protein [Streptomyces sodiiphilus]|uniref:DUF5667 domain-containing protein n=2 Tax=Streptomyces sodiiphilus TaxID=226217 RepID=A0ABN2PN92_9ACTN
MRSVSTHRRANAFAHVLDESRLDEAAAEPARTADGVPPGEAEQTALLSVVEKLETLPRPRLSPETRTAQRAGLIAAMEAAFAEEGTPGRPAASGELLPGQRALRSGRGAHRADRAGPLSGLRPKSRLGKGLAAGGLTVGVAAGAFGGVAAASTNALPGDTLYGLKRGMEDLRLDFAGGSADRGRLHLDHAAKRLGEARRLMERGRAGELDQEQVAEVRRTLSSMSRDASEGHRLLSQAYEADGSIVPLQSLSAFSEKHRGSWTQLRDTLPRQLHDVSDEVTSVFDAIEQEITPLRALLPGEPDPSAGSAGGDGAGAEEPFRHRESPGAPPDPEGGPSGTPDSAGTGSPDGTGGEEDAREGLLGGGGLLDPDPESSPGATLPGGDPDGGLPQPEVTIPPLLEDLLPGIGIEVRDQQ